MILKRFKAKDGRKIVLRTFEKNDLKRVKEFMEYINSIVDEDDFIHINEKVSYKEEKEWIVSCLKDSRRGKKKFVVAESGGIIIGVAEVASKNYRMKHVAEFGISISKDFREIGIGKVMMKSIMEMAKQLKENPKVLQLSVFETNKRAIALYKKMGFKEVARIPKQSNVKGKLIHHIVMQKTTE